MSETPKNGGFAERTILLLRKQVIILKAMSFALIGVINSLIDFAVFLLALKYITESLRGGQLALDAGSAIGWLLGTAAGFLFVRLDLILANVVAWMVAVTGSYVMNSYVTFAAESGRKLRWKAFFAFAAAGILGAIGSTTTLVVAAEFMPVVAAKILAIGIGFLINFSMSHFVVFRPKKKHEG